MAVIVTLAAFVLPFTRTTLNAMNLISDARNVSGATALAKMRAAAHFTQARVFVSLTDMRRDRRQGAPVRRSLLFRGLASGLRLFHRQTCRAEV